MDNFIKKIIKDCLSDQEAWITPTFAKCTFISRNRDATANYGFEWVIQTAFSEFLLKKQKDLKISGIKITQEDAENKKRYDIAFHFEGSLVIIELKTSSKGDTSGVKSDMEKPYPFRKKVGGRYFLLFCYPFDDGKNNDIAGADLIDLGITHCVFKYFLYKDRSFS